METKVSEKKSTSFQPQSFTIDEAKTVISSHEVVFVDVRDQVDFTNGSIAGAVNIPLSSVESALNPENNSYSPVFNTDQTVVFYCKCGGMSAKACEIAETAGFTNTKYLEGGFSAWKEEVSASV